MYLVNIPASLLITENASNAAPQDIEQFFSRMIPDSHSLYQHDAVGVCQKRCRLKVVFFNQNRQILMK
jgi:thiamine phosphate synthase YjbQ (UPF0047 family)